VTPLLRKRTFLLLAVSCSILAFQNALAPVGWTNAQANQMAQSFFTSSTADASFFLGYLSKPVKDALRAKPPAERARIVRELALYAKSLVQAPAFEPMHAKWIRESLDAVNHGIPAARTAAPESMEESMNNARGQMAAEIAQSLQSIPPEALRMMLQSEADSLKGRSGEQDKKNLAAVQQMLALIPTRYAEAKQQYVRYMVAKMGGPSDDASIQASVRDAAKAKTEQAKLQQQRNYDQHNLKAQLRRRLDSFIAEARSVDFNAQTRVSGGRALFVNQAYEAKNSTWKMLYRTGREPVMAAVDVADQWRRELR
jgi:hypothetical protein